MKTFTRKGLLLALLIAFSLLSNSQTISTLASGMGMPWNIATDGAGYIYAAGYADNKVWKINITTGVKTIYAGTGAGSFSGDGGQAASATLNSPAGVALDAAGNLYIADAGNSRIRKVTKATGIITTVAGNGVVGFSGDGGLAINAKLDFPMGVAVDPSNNIYFSDYSNNRVRKVNAADGKINTIAGNGAITPLGDGGLATGATLQTPMGIAFDASGNIYIADMDHHRIRKIAIATGIITTVAGNGSGTFAGDGAAATGASLQYPTMAAADGAGNIYIADQSNNRIREVTASTGRISTIAGDGSAADAGDGGMATSSKVNYPGGIALEGGALFLSGTNGGSVRRIANAYILLPVKLQSFTASKKDKAILLNWRTAQEINNAFFEVEHSANGQKWQSLGKVNAGERQGGAYSFIHTEPFLTNYYRLMQVDKDGNREYSEVVKIEFSSAANEISLQKNPVSGNTIRLLFGKPYSKTVGYTIVSTAGTILQQGTVGEDRTIEINTIAAGNYLLSLSNGQVIRFQKN